jgi:hypothetical protein
LDLVGRLALAGLDARGASLSSVREARLIRHLRSRHSRECLLAALAPGLAAVIIFREQVNGYIHAAGPKMNGHFHQVLPDEWDHSSSGPTSQSDECAVQQTLSPAPEPGAGNALLMLVALGTLIAVICVLAYLSQRGGQRKEIDELLRDLQIHGPRQGNTCEAAVSCFPWWAADRSNGIDLLRAMP